MCVVLKCMLVQRIRLSPFKNNNRDLWSNRVFASPRMPCFSELASLCELMFPGFVCFLFSLPMSILATVAFDTWDVSFSSLIVLSKVHNISLISVV
uniref:Uncharacterized protein n=1 Tax=Anguilla anguilla TaxID=7936 RepID=A0A0E9RRE9_ANGAN